MRKISIIILFLITVLSANAQEKRWENNFYLGQGLILDFVRGGLWPVLSIFAPLVGDAWRGSSRSG